MTIYEEIFKALAARGVRYLVVGGVAVVLHGFLRATADLDLFVDFEPDNMRSFLELLKNAGYRPKPPVPMEDFASDENRRLWKKEKGMLVFSVFHPRRPMELIDIFLDEPISFAKAYGRRRVVGAGNARISVMAPEDLVELKKKAARPQDLEDIKALREILRRKKAR